jgi:N-acetylmuramoyl-L-alanine amidase
MDHRRWRAGALAVLGTLVVLAVGMRAHAADDAAGRIERIELKADGSSTKVIVMLSRPLAFDVHVLDGDAAKKSARRLVLDFADTTLAPDATKPIEVANDLLRQIRPGQFNAKTARIVLDLANDTAHSVDAFESPPHVTIALTGTATTAGTPATDASDASNPTASTGASEAPKPAVSTGASEAPKATARTIPIRARGRRPYSLNYSR